MKKIPLTNDKFALVDDEDYNMLIKYKWVAVNLFSDKYYARNQKFGLMSKFIMKTSPDENPIVDFLNGDTLDCRRSNLVKRKEAGKDSKLEILKQHRQLCLDLNVSTLPSKPSAKKEHSGVHEKVIYEAKYVDQSGRVFNFGTFENKKEALEAYRRNMKMIFQDS